MKSSNRSIEKMLVQLAIAIVLTGLVGCAACKCKCPSGASPVIAPPEGNDIKACLTAEGVQIYSWSGTNWTFKGPEAELFGKNHLLVGRHYAGPTWEGADGSKVTGTVVTNEPSPNANSIPLLLLKGNSTHGRGIFNAVSYIQRLETVGGKPPIDSGTSVGQTERIKYTATYVFYTSGH